ncbi:MAG: hypothetical protein ACK5N8_03340 [Alphaproteobacteria bacterium]
MNKNIFFIFTTLLIFTGSCSTDDSKDIVFSEYTGEAVYSGYNPYGHPYGAEVKCDAELPLDELRQCITDAYLAMDKRRMTPVEEDERKKEKIYKEGMYSKSKEYNFPDTHSITFKEIPEFKSIKNCYKKNKCYAFRKSLSKTYDNYKHLISIEDTDAVFGIIHNPDCPLTKRFGEETAVLNCQGIASFGLGRIPYRHFTRSYRSDRKDLVAFYDGKLNAYTAGLEVVRLKDGKNLVAIRILEFRTSSPEKEGYEFYGTFYQDKVSKANIKPEGMKHKLYVSKGFTLWDIREDGIQEMSDNLAISLDKREYPTKIYINTGKKVYEVPIPTDKDKIR